MFLGIPCSVRRAGDHSVGQGDNEMGDMPYWRFLKDDLTLRDELAIDRTILANERTLMAYLRSAVALLIAGVSMMHFSQHVWFSAVGIICIPASVFTGIVGVLRFRKMNQSITAFRTRKGSSAESGLGGAPKPVPKTARLPDHLKTDDG